MFESHPRCEARVYDLIAYNRMILDQPRIAAYVEALRRSIRPGDTVVDLGAGTGIMTLLACRFGAGRVYAIEPDDAIQVARELVRENGFVDRVKFFQQLSNEVELPARAQVIVSDLRGVVPLFGRHLPVIRDARERLLAPGGVLIPQRDSLFAALVEAPELHDGFVCPPSPDGLDLHFAAIHRRATNSWRRVRVVAAQLLSAPQPWVTIDYRTAESPDFAGIISFTALRAGTAHGFALWFDAELAGGAGFSNSPSGPELIYGNAFFPFPEPLQLAAGDAVRVNLRADLVESDYVWRWDTAAAGREFSQSTFHASVASPEQFHRQAASHVPSLNPEGEVDFFILERLQRQMPLGEIAAQLTARFPSRFASRQQALSRVGELSLRYSR